MTIFGTRPEAIKMAPVVKQLAADDETEPVVVVTGQHREMLKQVLDFFKIQPDYDLAIMTKNQRLDQITSRVLLGLGPILEQERPAMTLVHGDTTTTMAASLRTWDLTSPFPEEANRQVTDNLASLYFAPTILSKQNLLKEHHPADRIIVTGNTAIDALRYTVNQEYHHDVLDRIPADHRIILLTMHRRENQGSPMTNVFQAVRDVALANPRVDVIYPVHLSPRVQELAHQILAGITNVHLIAPLDVVDFHNLAARSHFIMTDSGGVQEEAPSLNKPVLVLRDTTERPEGVTAGTLKLVGTDREQVGQAMLTLLNDDQQYQRMTAAQNPYGDGHAAERIVDHCKQFLTQDIMSTR